MLDDFFLSRLPCASDTTLDYLVSLHTLADYAAQCAESRAIAAEFILDCRTGYS